MSPSTIELLIEELRARLLVRDEEFRACSRELDAVLEGNERLRAQIKELTQ